MGKGRVGWKGRWDGVRERDKEGRSGWSDGRKGRGGKGSIGHEEVMVRVNMKDGEERRGRKTRMGGRESRKGGKGDRNGRTRRRKG